MNIREQGKYSDEIIKTTYVKNKGDGIRMLFDKYYAALVMYARQMIYDVVSAEDIVQEFFSKLWDSDYLKNIEAEKLRSYLFRSIRNAVITYSKRNDLLRNTSDVSDIIIEEEVISNIDEELIAATKKAIRNLPERTRIAVEKVMVEHMKYQEAADEMGISINTVKYLLKDGLKKLRTELKR